MSAADAVAEILSRSGLSKSALSARSGVSRSLLDEYLRGQRQPSVAQLERIGKAAGLRMDVSWVPVQLETPRWARPNPAMDPPPLTMRERARALELVCEIAMEVPARERGPLMFPPFRTLVAR